MLAPMAHATTALGATSTNQSLMVMAPPSMTTTTGEQPLDLSLTAVNLSLAFDKTPSLSICNLSSHIDDNQSNVNQHHRRTSDSIISAAHHEQLANNNNNHHHHLHQSVHLSHHLYDTPKYGSSYSMSGATTAADHRFVASCRSPPPPPTAVPTTTTTNSTTSTGAMPTQNGTAPSSTHTVIHHPSIIGAPRAPSVCTHLNCAYYSSSSSHLSSSSATNGHPVGCLPSTLTPAWAATYSGTCTPASMSTSSLASSPSPSLTHHGHHPSSATHHVFGVGHPMSGFHHHAPHHHHHHHGHHTINPHLTPFSAYNSSSPSSLSIHSTPIGSTSSLASSFGGFPSNLHSTSPTLHSHHPLFASYHHHHHHHATSVTHNHNLGLGAGLGLGLNIGSSSLSAGVTTPTNSQHKSTQIGPTNTMSSSSSCLLSPVGHSTTIEQQSNDHQNQNIKNDHQKLLLPNGVINKNNDNVSVESGATDHNQVIVTGTNSNNGISNNNNNNNSNSSRQYYCSSCGIRFTCLTNLKAHQTYYCSRQQSTTIVTASAQEAPAPMSGAFQVPPPVAPSTHNRPHTHVISSQSQSPLLMSLPSVLPSLPVPSLPLSSTSSVTSSAPPSSSLSSSSSQAPQVPETSCCIDSVDRRYR